jgi:hypothetical protein
MTVGRLKKFFCPQKSVLDSNTLQSLSSIPLTSQFLILYWAVKHKIMNGTCSEIEYHFVMETLLNHTMGQMFNIRLHAQYLATKLHQIRDRVSKYDYTIEVIQKTFVDSANDKNFARLQRDFFVNHFDIVKNFTPSFIYYFLPRYCDVSNNELVDIDYLKDTFVTINSNLNKNMSKDIQEEWYGHCTDEEVFSLNISKHEDSKVVEDVETSGTIQKKYIPWKNMSDVHVYETEKKVRFISSSAYSCPD